jgi:hypothetical protein
MINNNKQNTDTDLRTTNSKLTLVDRQTRIQELFKKLSLEQKNDDKNSNSEPRNLRTEEQSIILDEKEESRNSEVRLNQTLSQDNTQPELINYRSYGVKPDQAQQIVGIIHDIKISGLELANQFLQEKLSQTDDSKTQRMLTELLNENKTAIYEANIDKLNQELNKQLQEIIQQSQIMEFLEQDEQYQKQRKAESSFALQTSPQDNSRLGGMFENMGISFQSISGNDQSSVMVIDQEVNNQNAIQTAEREIVQYQIIQQVQTAQMLTSTQSSPQNAGWVNSVRSQANGSQTTQIANQPSQTSNVSSSKQVVGSWTASVMANQGKNGLVVSQSKGR